MESTDFDVKYRPHTLADVVGQDAAVSAVRGFGKQLPRAILFHGPSGTGKTTLARIVAADLGIGRMDLEEKNCGVVESAIELVRDINAHKSASPMGGKYRAWILDEVQTFSRTKHAQEALLKILEDSPPHVVYMLCTTDPQRLLPAIRGRCVSVAVKAIKPADLRKLVDRVAKAEKITLGEDVADAIVERANGAARDVLKNLQKVSGISPADQLAALDTVGAERAAFDLVKELMPFKGSPSWSAVAKVLADIKDEEPEGLRQMILACARTALLKDGQSGRGPHAYKVIKCLADPLFDRNSGHALLAAAAYQIVFAASK